MANLSSRFKWTVPVVAVGLILLATGFGVAAQQNECKAVLLCPGDGSVVIEGKGDTGDTTAVGGVVVSAALKLDKTVVALGQMINGTVTYTNASKAPVTLRTVTIAARGPGATNSQGPYTDLTPSQTNVTLQPKGTVTVKASRIFSASDRTGKWRAYATYQDASGNWHDSTTNVGFEVVASSGGGGGKDDPVVPPVNPVAPVAGKMTLGTQEWFVTGGSNNWAGTNLFIPNVNWATAYSSGTNIWNPQFLADLNGFSTFRHMDTNAVNWSKIASWNQRKLPTDPRNAEIYIDGSSPPDTTGMAVEWQIDLCNRANIDCWFTHPYLADDNYMRQQALLIKDKLKSGLKVYIELSNEVWNGAFSAFDQSIRAGQQGGLPGSSQWYQGIAHEMYRALQMYQIYQDVFGAGAMGTRVIRVFSESGNLDLTTQALNNVYRSSRWNPKGQKIDMMALAPYIGNGVDGAAETLERWKRDVDSKVNGEPIQTAVEQNRSAGIPLLGCYEGGMHHLKNAHKFAENPIAYDAYMYMFDRFATKMNAPCNLYTLHGTWATGGAWGMYSRVGQPLSEAHKARAAHDWMRKRR